MVAQPQNDLWAAVEARLDVRVHLDVRVRVRVRIRVSCGINTACRYMWYHTMWYGVHGIKVCMGKE